MPTNDENRSPGEYQAPAGDIGSYPESGEGSAEAGYEMTDANVGGVAAFLGGLFGFVLIFFFFCFLMGKVINSGIEKQDGPVNQWHKQTQIFAGKEVNGNLENLKSNAAMQQQELQMMTTQFPGPRLQTDDGNQETADLHAREDLLLDHYSSVPGQPLRIPIQQAMQLIAQRGLPVATADVQQQANQMAHDAAPGVSLPLTDGFARTGPELDSMEARAQKLDYGKAEAAEHAELKPIR